MQVPVHRIASVLLVLTLLLWQRRMGEEHTLEATEVDVSAIVKEVKQLVSVLLHLVLDVHLATVLVLHLS